ncbi:hypothetical protein FS749_000978 [Ceratobasidium sp. UAMH 11750]|nr:hypothetical protein FS749_000978 [Ceratobasidium sp. UAMH 11750]
MLPCSTLLTLTVINSLLGIQHRPSSDISGDENHGATSCATTSNPRRHAAGDSTGARISTTGNPARAAAIAGRQPTNNVQRDDEVPSPSEDDENESPPRPNIGPRRSPRKPNSNVDPHLSARSKRTTTTKRKSPDTTGESRARSGTSKRLRTIPDDPEADKDDSRDHPGGIAAHPHRMADNSDGAATSRDANGGYERSEHNGRGDQAVSDDEEHDGDNGPGPATQRRQALNQMLAEWEGSVRLLRDKDMKLNADAAAAAEVLANAEIGSAFVRFTGPGDIFGVVSLEMDPNSRGNPRALNEGHRDLLYEILRRPNAKRDWESPLFLSVPADLIADDLRVKMKGATATDPMSTPPLLKLIRPHEDEEIRLENEIWLRREGERWLSNEELADRDSRLEDLRLSRERCMLLNGNHRIRAMLRVGEDIVKIRNEIKEHITNGDLSQEEINEMSDKMWERIEEHTWRCVVYDQAKLTNTAKTMLVRNQHEKPAMGMGLGEKAWWLAEKFETEIQAELVAGAEDDDMDRAAAANIVQERWRREIGSKMLMTGNEEEAEEVKMAQKSKKLGDMAGNDASSRLFFNRLGMDMIMNVKDGEGLTDAENWLAGNEKMTAEGHADASKHYMALHVKTERVPQLLSYYRDKQANKFGDIFSKEFNKLHDETFPFLDPGNEDHIISLRRVFDSWGKYMSDVGSDDHRRIGASARLYSRLTLHRPGFTGPSFFPTAVLPCKAIFQQYVDKWTSSWAVPGNGDCLFVLEELLDRNSIVWTIGAQGNSKSVNWSNWYHRLRGLHQIVARLIECKTLGPVEARLSEALIILEDPRLPMSLHAVEDSFKEGKTFRDFMRKFSAMKSGSFHYHGAQALVETYEDQVGAFEDFSARVGKARSAIKAITWTEDAGKSKGKGKGKKKAVSTLDDVLGQHQVLSIVHHSFWPQAHPDWFTGWRDSEAKRMATVGAAIGWALLDKWLVDTAIPELFLNEPARWSLWIADRVLRACGTEPWWLGIFEARRLPARPKELPDSMKEFSRSKARKEALADKKRKGEADPVPVPKKKRNKKDQAETSGPAATKPATKATGATAGDSRAKANSSRTDKKSPAVYPSDIDAEDEPAAGGGDGAVTQLAHADAANNTSATAKDRHRDNGSTNAAKNPAKATPIVPGAEEFDLPFTDRKALAEQGRGVQSPPKGFRYHHQSDLRPVPHVFAAPIASTLMPHNAWNQLCAARDVLKPTPETARKMEEHITNALAMPGEDLRDVLSSIWQERSNLRSGLVDMFNVVRHLNACTEASLMLMPDIASGLRDIFLVRCANIFVAHFGCNEDEALHEATRMASADGMIDCNFTEVTPDGRLRMDLTCTFPKDLQARVRAHARFCSPALGISSQDRETASRMFQLILPARGMGRTHVESRERAVRSIEHQTITKNRLSRAPNAVHGLRFDPKSDPVVLSQTDREGPGPMIDIDRREAEWKSVEPTIVPKYDNPSPWSWGTFLPDKYPSTQFLRSGGTRTIEQSYTRRQVEYKEAWRAALQEEYLDWLEYRTTVAGFDPEPSSSGAPPPDDVGKEADTAFAWDPSQHPPATQATQEPTATRDYTTTQNPMATQNSGPIITSSPSLGNPQRVPVVLVPDSQPGLDEDETEAENAIPSNQQARRQMEAAISNANEPMHADTGETGMASPPPDLGDEGSSPRVTKADVLKRLQEESEDEEASSDLSSLPGDEEVAKCRPTGAEGEREYTSLFTQPHATKANAPGMPGAPKRPRVLHSLNLRR